jgi:hypothetical protein
VPQAHQPPALSRKIIPIYVFNFVPFQFDAALALDAFQARCLNGWWQPRSTHGGMALALLGVFFASLHPSGPKYMVRALSGKDWGAKL